MADGAGALPVEIKAQLGQFLSATETLNAEVKALKSKVDPLDLAKIDRIAKDVEEQKAAINDFIAEQKRQAKNVETKGDDPELVDYGYSLLERKAVQHLFRDGNLNAFYRDQDVKNLAEKLELKDLSSLIPEDGGFSVLPDYLSEMIEIELEMSPMREICRVVETGTRSIKLPVDRKGANAVWATELSTRANTNTPTLSEVEINVHELYARPLATKVILEDAGFDIEGWIADSAREAFEIEEGRVFILGTGDGQPRGFLTFGVTAAASYDANTNWGTFSFRPTGAAGAFAPSFPGASPSTQPSIGADVLFDLMYDLKPRYRKDSTWVMNRQTLGGVRKLKSGDGVYLIRDQITEDGIITMILGRPVAEMEDMPDMANNSLSIALGDFGKAYTIVDRLGLEIEKDTLTRVPYVQWNMRRRVGGNVTHFDAIKLLRFSAS